MIYHFLAALSIRLRKHADNWQTAKKRSKILRRMQSCLLYTSPANPSVQDATPDSTVAALPKTGVNWFTALAMALSGMALTVAGAFTSLFAKSKH